MKTITDKTKIEEILTRGVEAVYPSGKFLRDSLLSGKRLTLYTGYDPTAPSLHIGHGITLLKLRQFQELGHKVVMLVGDFTGMIGDPTDKTAARKRLTREEVLDNAKGYKKQAGAILDFSGENAVEIRYNSKWLAKMSFEDVVELAAHFTVQRMLERDMFQERIRQEKPIYVHEFMYPLMQGYDSVAMDVDGEVGGNDQTFNMLVGRELMKAMLGKEKFVLTTRLLVDTSGKKMSKSEGNVVALTDSPEEMFGKVMSWPDGMIESGFELCTRVPVDEIASMVKQMKGGANPRDFKLRLAFELTSVFLGRAAAERGRNHFESVIQKKQKPTDIAEIKPSALDIISVLVESGLCKSKSDARRNIDGGGVRVNDEKISSYDSKLSPGDVIQKGKRHFVRVAR